MFESKLGSRLRRVAAGVLMTGLATGVALGSGTAYASGGKSCIGFVVDFNGKTFKGKVERTITDAQARGKSIFVHGTMVNFSLNLDTWQVTNYTVTAASDVTDVDTVVFASKAPQLASKLTGSVSLKLSNEQLVIERGSSTTMKIQAKDCSTGGIFQMEAEPGQTYVHQLAHGFSYYEDDLGRTLAMNGTVIVRESPELASLVSRTDTTSTWAVSTSGRMGAVFGEDATQA